MPETTPDMPATDNQPCSQHGLQDTPDTAADSPSPTSFCLLTEADVEGAWDLPPLLGKYFDEFQEIEERIEEAVQACNDALPLEMIKARPESARGTFLLLADTLLNLSGKALHCQLTGFAAVGPHLTVYQIQQAKTLCVSRVDDFLARAKVSLREKTRGTSAQEHKILFPPIEAKARVRDKIDSVLNAEICAFWKERAPSSFNARCPQEWKAGAVEPNSENEEGPKADKHSQIVAKLKRHIDKNKANGREGITSKAKFYKPLGIDKADYYRWEGRKAMRAPGYALIIERKISALPD